MALGSNDKEHEVDVLIERNAEEAKAGRMMLEITIPAGKVIESIDLDFADRYGDSLALNAHLTAGWMDVGIYAGYYLPIERPTDNTAMVNVTINFTDGSSGATLPGEPVDFPLGSWTTDGIIWPGLLQPIEMTLALFNSAFFKTNMYTAPVARIQSKSIKTYDSFADARADINSTGTRTIAQLRGDNYKGYVCIQLNVILLDGTTDIRLSEPVLIK